MLISTVVNGKNGKNNMTGINANVAKNIKCAN